MRRRGAHSYHGKRNSRWQRTFSKLGIKKDYGLARVFDKLEKEKLKIMIRGVADSSENLEAKNA